MTLQFVTGASAQATTVPRNAVVKLGGKATAWVVTDDRAEPREVTTGLEGADRVQILSGVEVGERVIARGHDGLYAGARVTAMPDSGSPGAPAGAASEGARACTSPTHTM